MSDFKIFSNGDLYELLADRDLELLREFQEHLTHIRSQFGRKNIPLVTPSEAYLTAWELGWVDFRNEPITDLYKIDFIMRTMEYRKAYNSGLVLTAKLKWIFDFNNLIEFPEDQSRIFGKKPTHPQWLKG